MQLNQLIKYDEAVKMATIIKENGLDHLDFSILIEQNPFLPAIPVTIQDSSVHTFLINVPG